MRCRPWLWLIGLLPLALVAWFVDTSIRPGIEQDLSDRTRAALATEGLDWARPVFDGRDGALSGTAFDEDEQRRAVDIASRTWGVRMIADKAGVRAVIEPYTWQATLEEGRLRIKGFAQSEADQQTILGLVGASFPSASIDDRMEVGRGRVDRDAWLSGIGFALDQLAELKEGQVRFSDADLSIRGEAASGTAFTTVKTALRGKLPRGVALVEDAVIAPRANPYRLSARFDGRKLRLEGHAPNEDSRVALKRAAQTRFPRARIEDALEIASGEPGSWREAADAAFLHLAMLEIGDAEFANTSLTFSGVAADQATAEKAAKGVRLALPAIYRSTENVTFRKASVAKVAIYTWSADFDGRQLQLDGNAPDDAVRAAILAEVTKRLPPVTVRDRITIAEGSQPADNWRRYTTFAITQLGLLKRGRVELRDNKLTIRGEAHDQDAQERIKTALRALPFGLVLQLDETRSPVISPYVWRLSSRGDDVELAGHVPSNEVRKEIVAYANTRFAGRNVLDRMSIGAGAPGAGGDWKQTVLTAIRAVAIMGDGSAELVDRRLSISGFTNTEDLPGRISALVRRGSLPNAFEGSATIDYLGPSEDDLKRAADSEAKRKAETEARRLALEDKARRKAVAEEQRLAEEADARRKADEEEALRLAETAEARRKAEDEEALRLAETAEARRKAEDEERRLAETAEARRKAEVEKRRLAEAAEVRRKAEDEKRRLAEAAEARRVAEAKEAAADERRLAEEAETKRLAEEVARDTAAAETSERESYKFGAGYDGLVVALDGEVETAAQQDEIVTLAEKTFPERQIVDRIRVKPGAPSGWIAAVRAGLRQLSGLESGALRIDRRTLSIEGKADRKEAADEVRRTLDRDVPGSFTVDDKIAFVEPAEPTEETIAKQKEDEAVDVDGLARGKGKLKAKECRAVLNTTLKRSKAFFRPGSAKLDNDGKNAVGELRRILTRCPASELEVAGHTDSDGAATFNKRLSKRRAEAVVDFLAGKGVSRRRLTAVGFGEEQPVARNDNASNKAKNRRIEFEIRQK